ncbi:hypothetical protein DAPPUDRAFT_252278 [Daphnia pulex]|uniref:Uncharacterized protein n=1 Tax=Daphnia pulex TaxID=6669 RepID=E9H2E3_DAPPU|nr:hypothetical protein DAPPUDRAFT_252278 [Daphnia pulex]|eukprot:EFX74162.1 hypothetical protein DAPPUDRAFT_252278 [Daphnia pulex]
MVRLILYIDPMQGGSSSHAGQAVHQLLDLTEAKLKQHQQRCSLTAVSQELSIISTPTVVVLYTSRIDVRLYYLARPLIAETLSRAGDRLLLSTSDIRFRRLITAVVETGGVATFLIRRLVAQSPSLLFALARTTQTLVLWAGHVLDPAQRVCCCFAAIGDDGSSAVQPRRGRLFGRNPAAITRVLAQHQIAQQLQQETTTRLAGTGPEVTGGSAQLLHLPAGRGSSSSKDDVAASVSTSASGVRSCDDPGSASDTHCVCHRRVVVVGCHSNN